MTVWNLSYECKAGSIRKSIHVIHHINRSIEKTHIINHLQWCQKAFDNIQYPFFTQLSKQKLTGFITMLTLAHPALPGGLGWLVHCLCTKRLQVWSPVGEHRGGNPSMFLSTLMFLSLSPSFSICPSFPTPVFLSLWSQEIYTWVLKIYTHKHKPSLVLKITHYFMKKYWRYFR